MCVRACVCVFFKLWFVCLFRLVSVLSYAMYLLCDSHDFLDLTFADQTSLRIARRTCKLFTRRLDPLTTRTYSLSSSNRSRVNCLWYRIDYGQNWMNNKFNFSIIPLPSSLFIASVLIYSNFCYCLH
jgi:hypothetical protein